MTRAFLGGSVHRVAGIGKIELRNRSNPVRSIASGTGGQLTIEPDEMPRVPPAN